MTRIGKRTKAFPGAAPFDSALGKSATPLHEPLMPIVFKGKGAQVIAGLESRQVYCFSSNDPEQMVDARDAEALLMTGLFRMHS